MKKHRKLLTLGVVICLVAGLVAGIVYYKQVEEERKLSLIYIPKVVDGTNDFWTSLIQGAEMAAKEYNADIRVWAPEEENDVAGQNKLIERAIEEKPDAILISPSSFTESDQLLKKAKEQGIHIAFIDSYTQEEVQDLTVATDNLEEMCIRDRCDSGGIQGVQCSCLSEKCLFFRLFRKCHEEASGCK